MSRRKGEVVCMSYTAAPQVLIIRAGVCLFCPNQESIKHLDVLAELAVSAYRPGTEEELRELDSRGPDLKTRYVIIALGSSIKDAKGVQFFSSMGPDGFRSLPLIGSRWWGKTNYFLALHKNRKTGK